MSISIFAKPAFTNVNHGAAFAPAHARTGHLLRVSSIIRADQIAERLGARLNPESNYADDVCVYVKPHVKPGQGFEFAGRPYLDIIDGWALTPVARAHPAVGVIACSQFDGAMLRRVLPNSVVVIPQHHCNFERAKRTREGVTRVGVIGTDGAFVYLPVGLERALAERGIELECFSKFFTRQDVIDFYERIDVQVVWRPYRMRLANPLKLVNAASFGVPTIALQEDYFREMGDSYLPVNDLAGALAALDQLRDSYALYAEYSARCLAQAAPYHIDRICDLYRRLT